MKRVEDKKKLLGKTENPTFMYALDSKVTRSATLPLLNLEIPAVSLKKGFALVGLKLFISENLSLSISKIYQAFPNEILFLRHFSISLIAS